MLTSLSFKTSNMTGFEITRLPRTKNFGEQLLMTINEIWPNDKNLM